MRAVRVLLVDDEPELLEPLAARLERRGFACTKAESAEDALRLLGGQSFDCAVVDIIMPGRSGLDLLRCMRQEWPAIPVVLMTGHGAAELPDDGISLGAAECLHKPVALDELVTCVERVTCRS
ncbi:MAG: response regulator [Deltaproteobacteria bacterium]|nr:response regulator [Deltaproteobacteria bacterium]